MNILFECMVGSHLYGTNHENSDTDFCGVFIPTEEEVFSMGGPPEEVKKNVKLSDGERNKAGDIDRKFWSLFRFANLLLKGNLCQRKCYLLQQIR